MSVQLSAEQQKFVQWASLGANVLVDACIGSGKTTSIQALCRALGPSKNILYLTYNKLLKLDAKSRISDRRSQVTNYHGFAYTELMRAGIRCGFSDIMQTYNLHKPIPFDYDLMILDEYQDIDWDIAQMLLHIKKYNPRMQIVAVGDLDQKIYDNTRLDVSKFIVDFLGPDYKPMEFTQCFRLNGPWAAQLGDVWEKEIVGVNPGCTVDILSPDEAFDYLVGCEPKDILCLGRKGSKMADLQNRLEEEYGEKFNKYTVWSKIADQEGGATQPTPDSAVFTTYDGSKGMERDVCVLFDWTEKYWQARLSHNTARYEIVRNIFCVAASRGKKKIIIIDDGKSELLSFDMIKKTGTMRRVPQVRMNVSDMFDYKYIEDIEDCYKLLKLEQVEAPGDVINAPMSDGLIDLSPCIGNFQEASYFTRYDIDGAIDHCKRMGQGDLIQPYNTSGWSVFGKLLYLTALETNQARYVSQVRWDFLPAFIADEIHARLGQKFTHDEQVQVSCSIDVMADGYGPLQMNGVCDVLLANHELYELKFVSSLSHIHFLQTACYLLAMDLRVGYLYNTRDGECWKVEIPDRAAFLDQVVKTVTKGRAVGVQKLTEKETVRRFISRHPGECRDFSMLSSRTAADAEQFMAERGLALPVEAAQFVRYFGRKSGKKRRK